MSIYFLVFRFERAADLYPRLCRFRSARLQVDEAALSIADGSAALTGILLALNLPPSSPWWMALLGSAIAILIGKQIYGGLGYNPFNPALVARVVLLISFPVQMTTWTAPAPLGSGIDAVTTATPLGEIEDCGHADRSPADLATSGFGHYFLGNMGGCLGEVSALALLLGGLFLIFKKVISWHTPVSFLGTVIVLSGIFWLSIRANTRIRCSIWSPRPDSRGLFHGHGHGHLAGHPARNVDLRLRLRPAHRPHPPVRRLS